MADFETKDSGAREDFNTGSRRDVRTGKGRYDLLPYHATRREAELLERGATKYGDRNWELGQPFSRCFDSAMRHLMKAKAGMKDEDHLAAVVFNVKAIIEFEEMIARGELDPAMNDMPWAIRESAT